jgi:hypothetical protein
VRGSTVTPDGIAVSGISSSFSTTATGVHGFAAFGFAGLFDGRVRVTGMIEKAGGGFKIDHPLDPANSFLVHSFVESPDMKNVYDGTVTTDASGEAVVTLPSYFETLNRDVRYQLTAIGAPAPGLHVAEEVAGNRFKIAGRSAEPARVLAGDRHPQGPVRRAAPPGAGGAEGWRGAG